MYFYIMPGLDMKEIKKDAFRDVDEKLKLQKHKLKKKLNIQRDDTPDIVRAKAGGVIQGYDPEDVAKLLDLWCGEGNQV